MLEPIFLGFGFEIVCEKGLDVHLVAQTATAALNATCLQFKVPPPIAELSNLGHAGFTLPIPVGATRDRRTGRYKLTAVTER
jgi:hypothetical protein